MMANKHGDEKEYRWTECPKCGGRGRLEHYAHIDGGICYGCDGDGGRWENIEDMKAREAAAEKRAAAAQKRFEKKQAKARARLAETLEAHPEYQTILDSADQVVVDEDRGRQTHPGLPTRTHNELLRLLSFAQKLRDGKTLTEKQAAFALKLATPEPCPRCGSVDHAERDCSERAKVEPGRQAIEGVLVSERYEHNNFGGGSYKCLIVCDDGRRLWGTVPRFKTKNTDDPHPCAPEWRDHHAKLGARVSFMAAVERSDNDPHFGFYKRPTRGKILEQGTREPEHERW